MITPPSFSPAPASAPAQAKVVPAPRLRRQAPPAERELVLQLVHDLPDFVRLLYRLARDPRVRTLDKGIVLLALGYLAWPHDAIPDPIPLVGRLDDLLVLALALHRLLANAGTEVILDHWEGSPRSLELALGALDALGGLLPGRLQQLLSGRAG
jgi:uncharacterized membrane protein YkvA (DUF1232 family)